MEIEQQVAEVIAHSQGLDIKDLNVKPIIDKWREAKKRFINTFGGEIYEFPDKVTLTLTDKEKDILIDEFIDAILCRYENQELADFIEANRKTFFDNRVSVPSGGAKVGEKILRSFKYFVSDSIFLDRLQTEASMLIQQDRVTGTLCLSVHPLDYLSSSENTYNWRSCHALDGEYRAGNLAYMMDSCTIVCYVKGSDDKVLPRFPESVPWNSKKWRVLLFLSNDGTAMMAGRQYPFSTNINSLSPYIFSALGDKSGRWTPWHDDNIKEFKFKDENVSYMWNTICMKHNLVPIHYLIEEKSNLFFNDLLKSSCYSPFYCWKKSLIDIPLHDLIKEPMFTIGGKVPCPKCGKTHLDDSESMICYNCVENEGIRCTNCVLPLREGPIYWVYDAEFPEAEPFPFCESCYEKLSTVTCVNCGRIYYNDGNCDFPYVCPCCQDNTVED